MNMNKHLIFSFIYVKVGNKHVKYVIRYAFTSVPDPDPF